MFELKTEEKKRRNVKPAPQGPWALPGEAVGNDCPTRPESNNNQNWGKGLEENGLKRG